MLDMDFIVENPDVVKRAIGVKGIELDLDRVLVLHGEVKQVLMKVEQLRHERNVLSKQTGKAPPGEREQLIERSRAVGAELKRLEPELREKEEQLQELLLQVPNIPGPDEPVGADEESNVELRRAGEPPEFSFASRDHVELLEMHDWADLGRIGQVAGSRTYALKGDAVLLEMAIWRLAVDLLRKQDFVLVDLPSLAREAAFIGTGHFPDRKSVV